MLLTDLERLDPLDDRALADVMALETAAYAADQPYQPAPTPSAARAFRQYGWDGEPSEEWLHRDATGQAVGRIVAHRPTRENLHLVFGDVLVHPAHRRQGIGRRLFASLQELARQPGRRVLISDSRDTPGGRRFAEGLGFQQAHTMVLRRQDLQAVAWDEVDKLRTAARQAADGYTLLRFTGGIPDDLVDEVAALEASINDAPRGELDMEDFAASAARVRARERSIAAAGVREYRLVARRDRDGQLAGHTVMYVDPEQLPHGGQGDTSVLAAHRGHRLGMLLKSEMMYWIADAEPQVRWVTTGNAESNRHMIAINEALGYQVLARHVGWQRDL